MTMTHTKTKKRLTGLRLRLQTQTLSTILLMLLLMMTIVTVGLVSCSGKTGYDDDESTSTDLTNQKKHDRTSTSPAQTSTRTKDDKNARQNIPSRGMIKKVYYASRIVRADSAMKVQVETREPLKENQYLSFICWKNGKKLEEKQENTLPAFSFKKGDVIFTDVLLILLDI
jgi:hypothetical protein